jgi:hypothetical protein
MQEGHMPAIDGPLPEGKITAFDKDHYDKVVTFVDSVDQDLNKNLRKPSSGVRLDASLGSGIAPGSPSWPPAKRLIDQGVAFGASVAAEYDDLSKSWEAYVVALKNAREVFESTDNLATYGASKFATDYPDVTATTNNSGAGGNGGNGDSSSKS